MIDELSSYSEDEGETLGNSDSLRGELRKNKKITSSSNKRYFVKHSVGVGQEMIFTEDVEREYNNNIGHKVISEIIFFFFDEGRFYIHEGLEKQQQHPRRQTVNR